MSSKPMTDAEHDAAMIEAKKDEKTYLVVFNEQTKPMAVGDRVIPTGWKSKTVAADYFTVEPSGAVTFWIRAGERSALIAAYGHNEWKSIELAS